MRIATFNVENLFERAEIMNLPTWSESKPVIEDFNRLNDLISQDYYPDDNKVEIIEIAGRHRGLLSKGESKYIVLREIRGKFKKKPKSGPVEIVADGRADWIGWFELKKKSVKETAIENTARVIREIKADVLCVIEAENRITLKDFNDMIIPKVGGEAFNHVMLIEGNDDRGIDVGILMREGYSILSMVSHVDDTDDVGLVFSRDCPEYTIGTPSGKNLLVLINHFKSKGYGSAAESDTKRKRQAKRVRSIYEARLQQGYEYIAICGDLNDTPDSEPLSPLLQDGSNLTDVMAHPRFSWDGRPGTHGNGTKSGKFDYILMSPKLADKVQGASIERRGVWGGKNGTLFPHFPEVEMEKDAASDHAALWVDLNI